MNAHYQNQLREVLEPARLFIAGRLANYVYIDMDDCKRQALEVADEIQCAS